MGDTVKLNRIKGALADKGLQNVILAVYMNVHETTVSDWCTNKNQPSPADFRKIASFLNLDVRDLILSTDPGTNKSAALMIAEHSKFLNEGKSTYIYEGATETKKGKKSINPELLQRLKLILKSEGSS